jgi:hypothetical protein
MMWIAHTLERGVTYNTATAYLAAVKHVLRLRGVDVTVIDSMQLLKQMLQAAKKVHSRPTQPRLPITTDILMQLRPHVLNMNRNALMMWAAFTLAVAAMLRCGEFTVNSTNDIHLPLSALQWHNDQQGFTLTLPRDKTHDTPVHINVYKTGTPTCPVSHEAIHATSFDESILFTAVHHGRAAATHTSLHHGAAAHAVRCSKHWERTSVQRA